MTAMSPFEGIPCAFVDRWTIVLESSTVTSTVPAPAGSERTGKGGARHERERARIGRATECQEQLQQESRHAAQDSIARRGRHEPVRAAGQSDGEEG